MDSPFRVARSPRRFVLTLVLVVALALLVAGFSVFAVGAVRAQGPTVDPNGLTEGPGMCPHGRGAEHLLVSGIRIDPNGLAAGPRIDPEGVAEGPQMDPNGRA